MGFWLNLEQFNQAIADRTWVNCITDDNLIPCLNRALPFTDANGDPADAIKLLFDVPGACQMVKDLGAKLCQQRVP